MMDHIIVSYPEFVRTFKGDKDFIKFNHASDALTSQVKLDTCEGFHKGKAITVDYTLHSHIHLHLVDIGKK